MLSAFENIWSMSVTASVVIVFVLAARLLLKRSPKIISYALWAVVLFRLLCPVSLETGFSLIPKPVAEVNAPEVSFDISTASQSPGYFLSVPEGIPAEPLDISNAVVYTMPADVIRPAQTVAPETFRFPVEWVWFAGTVLLVLVSCIRYGLLCRKLRFSLPVRENIYLADGIPSAFVVDILHPKIYLPSDLPPEEWDYVLAHERCHIRRGDPLIRLLSFAAVCLHWFNPLVWLAFYLAGQDMEMSCDEAVIRALGENIRADYSQTLLNLSAGRKLFAFTPLAFGEGDTEKRIRNLGKWKKPVVWVVVMAVVLCAILAVCLLTDPKQEKPGSIDGTDDESTLSVPEITIPEGEFSYPFYGVPAVEWVTRETYYEGKTECVEIEQFPGVKFCCSGASVWAENIQTKETEILYSGMPIENVFYADLTGDGLPELCSAVYFGSGAIDSHIIVFDYANRREYALWERMENDYYLKLVDGILWAEQKKYLSDDEVVREGPLVLLAAEDTIVPAILDPSDRQFEMTPTASSMVGGYDGYLFIEINERTYRFRRETIDPEGLTADQLMGIYYENTIHDFDDTVHYQVYSTREYPDHTVLLVDVGGLYWASYRYAPAQRISDEAWEEIRSRDGILVLEDGDVTSGQEAFLAFARKAQEGTPGSIQTAAYYTLDPSRMVDELYQTVQEDYPCLYLHTLTYDGERFTISWEENGKRITRYYKYLMCYTGEPTGTNATYSGYVRYVLTNDNTVTWDDIFSSMVSSQLGAYIDHYTVYTDYLP